MLFFLLHWELSFSSHVGQWDLLYGSELVDAISMPVDNVAIDIHRMVSLKKEHT